MTSITVNASKEYKICIGKKALDKAGEKIKAACGGETAAIITDDTVNNLYGDTVELSLKQAGYRAAHRFVFPNGEQSKNINTYSSILNELAEKKLTRSDVVIALGGGVTGDMAGFAAATYQRGTSLAQIPTTLLAMVDSSVGGKTAINLPAGKNQAGVFYQPDIVLCDVDVLQTLSAEVFRNGCAEVIKHAMIFGFELFELLKKPIKPQIEDIITRNITIKRDIVVLDEKDTGIRQLLNFGHTIGHGIEKHSNYSISHGNAVAAGMAVTCRGAWRMGFCERNCYDELVDTLEIYRLPYKTDIPAEKLFEAAFSDKKRSGLVITEILPEKIGKCVLYDFNVNEYEAFIKLGTGD